MTTLTAKVASALSFAHLAGLGRSKPSAKASKAEEDDDKKPDDEKAKGKGKAEDDSPSDDDKKKDDDTSASADDDESANYGVGDDDEDEDDKKSKKRAKGKADDDSEEEMRGSSPAAAARRRERARCAAIFASPAAGKNPVLAANLAFKTSMARGEALAVLEGTPPPAAEAPASASRAARNPSIGAGGTSAPSTKQAIATSWDDAMKKARGGR